jgi:fructokinase
MSHPEARWYGGIEAGGTKFVCGVGRGPDDLVRESFPTGDDPSETLSIVTAWFTDQQRRLGRVGVSGTADRVRHRRECGRPR